MYIQHDHFTYDDNKGQHTTRGLFLILLSEHGKTLTRDNLRAIVRKVALSQFGYFMMGYAHIKGHRLTLSGSYGNDGLPCDVDTSIYREGILVPPELYDAWANGGGWNSAGNESASMRKWAHDNIKALYNVRK